VPVHGGPPKFAQLWPLPFHECGGRNDWEYATILVYILKMLQSQIELEHLMISSKINGYYHDPSSFGHTSLYPISNAQNICERDSVHAVSTRKRRNGGLVIAYFLG
jgi:hypothetical protein